MVIAAERTPGDRYTQALIRASGVLTETRELLQAWQPGESADSLLRRILSTDLLGKATARRSRDLVRWVFAPRFLLPDDAPARHLKRLIEGGASRQIFTDLAFFYTAQHDAFLYDFVVRRYWPAVRSGHLTVTHHDAVSLMDEAEQAGRLGGRWSSHVKPRLAGALFTALADFGLLGPPRPGARPILNYRPVDGTVVYLAYLLHRNGVTDAALADNPAWALFGLEPAVIWERLYELAARGWFVVQRAGQVVRISWTHRRMEEVLDALAG